jgi:hypothetical protein
MALPFVFTVPAAFQEVDAPEVVDRVADSLADGGYTWQGGPAEVSVSSHAPDGTRKLYVNCTPDPTAMLQAFSVRAKSKQQEATDALTARLAAFLALPSPTQAQAVAAIKDVIRAIQLLR